SHPGCSARSARRSRSSRGSPQRRRPSGRPERLRRHRSPIRRSSNIVEPSSLPSPVLTGSGSTGVISARTGTPVTPGYHRKMAVRTALWDDLLEGEELAHVKTIPAADARTAPLPDNLHSALGDELPFGSLYAHQ